MIKNLEKYIAREFEANSIVGTARARVHGVQYESVLSYLVDVFIGGKHLYRIHISSRPPFNPMISTNGMIEADKLKAHIEIIEEALKEIASRYFE